MDNNKKLGTFLGVYTPTVLTILGVIMYLRSGWLVGHLGLINSLVIICFANLITIITTLSFSAVTTNIKVKEGGAIGLPLFLSQTFSVTLYAYGFAEALKFIFPELHLKYSATTVIITVAILSYIGAEFALKFQIPLMGLVVISLVALGIGSFQDFDSIQINQASGEVGFWSGFAIFFQLLLELWLA